MTVQPAFPVPPHVRHGLGDELHIWFTEPPGAIVQMSKPQRGTVEQAGWLVGPGLELLRRRFPNAEKLLLVLDYRHMTGRDTAARTLMMDRAPDVAHEFAGVFIVPPLQTSPVYRTTLSAAAALVSAFGVEVRIVESLAQAIALHGLLVSSADPPP